MIEQFNPPDADFAQRVLDSFNRQQAMHTLGATLAHVDPGEVEITLPYAPELTQQHGFLHAGILSTILDSACGYAAYSLMSTTAGVLTIEFKINLLSPARGDTFRAVGKVRKPGRTITVAEGDMFAVTGDSEKLVATMTATLMTISGRGDVAG